MDIFKKFVMSGLPVLLIILLYGCHHDQKNAENIYHHLEKSAQLEKSFADQQQTLVKVGHDEQKLYDKIISSSVGHAHEIKTDVKKAQKYNIKQEQHLKASKKHFDRAFTTVSAIKPVVKEIKSPEQKKEASEIIKLMEKRYHLYQAYHKEYMDALMLNQELYKRLAKQDYKTSKLDKQIAKINQKYSNMKDQKQQFNHYTKQYNKAKKQYYQDAGLKANHVNS